jgi:hypothetical protein
MLPCDGKGIECREPSRFLSGFDVELRADAPDKSRFAAFGGQHPGQKQQITRLHRLHINTERLWRCWELDAKFFQLLLGTGWPRALTGYHLPTCEPPSTWSTSPVT